MDLDEARREEIWVNFKVFGVLGMTLVFLMFEFFIMMRFVKRYELDDLEEKRNDLDVDPVIEHKESAQQSRTSWPD